MSDDKYEVGYGKPPKNTRFQKGQSGNASGRPTGIKNRKTTWNSFMNEKVTLESGQIMTRRDVTRMALLKKGVVDKDMRAIGKILDIDIKFNPEYYHDMTDGDPYKEILRLTKELEAEKRRTSGGVLVAPADISVEEWAKKALKLREEMLTPSGEVNPDWIAAQEERFKQEQERRKQEEEEHKKET